MFPDKVFPSHTVPQSAVFVNKLRTNTTESELGAHHLVLLSSNALDQSGYIPTDWHLPAELNNGSPG